MSEVSAVAHRVAALEVGDNGSKARSATKFSGKGRYVSGFKVQMLL